MGLRVWSVTIVTIDSPIDVYARARDTAYMDPIVTFVTPRFLNQRTGYRDDQFEV